MLTNINQRSNLILKNIVASFVVKGWSAIVVLLMVPLTLKMLGVYNNGVWLTISGILIWIDFMDIGLGNGLRNIVAQYVAVGDDNKVRMAVSSTFFILTLIIIPLLLLFCALIQLLDMHNILGVSPTTVPNLNTILTIALTMTSITFILKAIGNLYMGLQLPAVSNLIMCLGQTLSLIATFAAYMLGCRSLLYVVFINTLSPLIVWASFFPYTFYHRYPQYRPSTRFIDKQTSLLLCSQGIKFFVLQIFSVVLFASVNVIISKLFSPSEVTPYQIAYRYFSLVLVLFNIISIPFWNATTDAYSRGDIAWIKNSSRKLDLVVGVSLLGLTAMVLLSNVVYSVWIGNEVHIPMELSAAMAAYIFVLVVSLRYSYILNGVNALRIQLIFTIFATIAFIPLSWFAGHTFNSVTSIVWVMCLINVPGMLANAWKYYQIFYKKEKSADKM
jgi:O-antigen/teichoic acid export membrane protein